MCTIIYLPILGVPFAIVPLKVVKLRLFEIIFKHCVFVQFLLLLLHTADKRQFSSQQEKSKGNKIFWQKTLHCRNGPFSSFREKRRASLSFCFSCKLWSRIWARDNATVYGFYTLPTLILRFHPSIVKF